MQYLLQVFGELPRTASVRRSQKAPSAEFWPAVMRGDRIERTSAPEHIPVALLPALGPILEQIGSLTERIHDYDRQLETICQENYPKTELLRQVVGVGALRALRFVLTTLEDPRRFRQSRAVGAYLGLAPGNNQSGDSAPQKRISREGDEMLRRL